MTQQLQRIVIVGGGSAGWITAGLIASKLKSVPNNTIQVTLIESPDVRTIGVGEGSWPTLRHTLHKIGISESHFIRECDASFKQGTEFIGWTNNNDCYYHPFTVPFCYPNTQDSLSLWKATLASQPFAHFASPQGILCDQNKAPKSVNDKEYAGFLNYGYHFNADKLGALLKEHCTQQLNVEYISDHVTAVESAENVKNADITALILRKNGRISGDLFIDCSGLKGLLIHDHYNVPWLSQKHVLFNDRALAIQVPYRDDDQPIPSCTKSTAQSSGWIWDIPLQNRRGTGYVYSSQFTNEDEAKQTLLQYLSSTNSQEQINDVTFREIKFEPGYRKTFWQNNCVAVGLSAGFIEPLEASAIVMVELSAQMIADYLPCKKQSLPVLASRFNELFSYRWQQIINFLKYHYVLSERQSEYWQAHQVSDSIPDSLQQMMTLWQDQPPRHNDFWHNDEIFSAASYQYVLFGMQSEGNTQLKATTNLRTPTQNEQQQRMQFNAQTEQLLRHLPSNKELLMLLKSTSFK